jgi:hypothetical protein
MNGLDQKIRCGNKEYDASTWNPIIVAIARKNSAMLELLFDSPKTEPNFHILNCLSKPYTKEDQKLRVFDQFKRIRRECFALKLSIRSFDEATFKFLWNENNLFWNMGHFFVLLQTLMKCNWEQGVKLLTQSTISKVIFMSSVTSVDDFIDTVDLLRD